MPTEDRRARIDALLGEALERPPDERTAWLAESCTDDPDLLDTLTRLLQYTQAEGPVTPGGALAGPFRDELFAYLADRVPADAASELVGQRVSHFQIEKLLGRGGMGVVYQAQDVRLDRRVALKFLARHASTDEEAKARLITEAKAASALDHDNIGTIHEIVETETGQLFIVMAFYDGETLAHRVSRATLDPAQAIDCAAQVAEGLDRAHRSGIVHRDIKPANLIVTRGGRIKILDFGIAKMAGAHHTRVGTMVGTAAYMSPEQTRGETVDARSDLWSLGVVLYEMLTGRKPFAGERAAAVIHAIRHDEPKRVRALRPDVSAALEQIVSRCLAKDPAARYQSAAALLEDLRSVAAGGAPRRATVWSASRIARVGAVLAVFLGAMVVAWLSTRSSERNRDAKPPAVPSHRVAVLPFTNLRNDDDTNFLGYALADQVIARIAYLEDVFASPSSAVRRFQGQVVDVQEAARQLNVDYVLTGSYLKQGDALRLNVELVEPAASEIVWRDTVEMEYDDIFRLLDVVAEQLGLGLAVQLTPVQRQRWRNDDPGDALAYEYYLRAAAYPTGSEQDNLRAQEMLERSLEISPEFASALAELGFRRYLLANFHTSSSDERHAGMSIAEETLHRALALDEELLSALGYLATLYAVTGRLEESVEFSRRALAINTNSFDAHYSLALVYRMAGALRESADSLERALVVDASNRRLASACLTYLYLRDYETAIELSVKGQAHIPGSSFPYVLQGIALEHLGREEEALARFERAMALDPGSEFARFAEVWTAYIRGERARGLEVLDTLQRTYYAELDTMPHRYLPEGVFQMGRLYAAFGADARAVELLKHAVDGGFFNHSFMRVDPMLERLREEPAFRGVLDEARDRHEAFLEAVF